jgi:hypothetical protein
MAYDQDLNKALTILEDQTMQLIIDTQYVTQEQAQTIMLSHWNCPISEMINVESKVRIASSQTKRMKNQ